MGDAPAAKDWPARSAPSNPWDLSADVPKWAPKPPTVKLPQPATACALELESAKAMRKLRNILEASCTKEGKKLKEDTLEHWRLAAKHEEPSAKKKPAHSVLPATAGKTFELSLELQRQGLSAEGAAAAAEAVGKEAARHAANMLKLAHSAASGKLPPAPPLEVSFNRDTVDLSSGKTKVKLSRATYGKLALLHRRHAPASEVAPALPAGQEGEEAEVAAAAAAAGDAQERASLHLRLFAMLLRLKSLRGSTFHSTLGAPVWEVLRAKLGVACECYASPLNAYLPAFGSAFADVEAPFGSRGAFSGFAPLTGSFAVHPPNVSALMMAAATHVLSLLAASDLAPGDHALSFVVVLPGWRECAGYELLSDSAHCKRRVLVAEADHGYTDGASAHLRHGRKAAHDTAVFVLQSAKAARKWPADDSLEAALRTAFAAGVPKEGASTASVAGGGGAGAGAGASGAAKGKKRKHDDEIEGMLDRWVQLKRKAEWGAADSLREELREKGIKADEERPPKANTNSAALMGMKPVEPAAPSAQEPKKSSGRRKRVKPKASAQAS